MIVVSDAGPLIYLGGVGRLDVLRGMFGRVVIPRQVWDEIVVAGAGLPGSSAVAAAEWIVSVVPSPSRTVVRLAEELDAGEAAAIALCLEMRAQLLLCDDLQGRRAAEAVGVRVVGTFGVLLQAKAEGYVSEVTPIIEAMLAMGFRASSALVASVIETARE